MNNKIQKLLLTTTWAMTTFLAFSSVQAVVPEAGMADANPSDAQMVNAAPVNTLKNVMTAALISVDNQGQEQSEIINEQTRISSGDVIEYRSYFINNTPDRVRSFVATVTIPEGLKLIGNMTPELPYASIDGHSFYPSPLSGTVDGVVQNIGLEHYKALRWQIDGIDLNKTVMVSYRVKVK